ncbi:class I SAM-dependent methyltransferase [Persicobacter diffluens]|uniref:Methyltransferase domain-containing protein n=1 Tax=Persicobacter diffluens TaxID=981 RepID=A0AAN4W3F8_9BACT|nr:hypothetical protein PEDI_44850 [Persicobacter diffluens]
MDERFQDHWEKVYADKPLPQMSWFQETPHLSLRLIEKYVTDKEAHILDIGGGDSFLVDHLLKMGYTNISVLDISSNAIERAKKRLAGQAAQVNWIVSDVLDLGEIPAVDFWHDRATFHFLGKASQKMKYMALAESLIKVGGYFSLGTFSDKGPEKCSGIPVSRYTEQEMETLVPGNFMVKGFQRTDHPTPFDTFQNFLFGLFEKQ